MTARAVAVALILTALGPTAGQDKQKGLPQEKFLGQWVNANPKTEGLKRLAITKQDGTWSIAAWGAAGEEGTAEIPWKKVTLDLLGSSVADTSRPYGFATWKFDFATVHVALRFEKGQLVAEEYTIFTDKSGRSNFRVVEKFKKK
jgi:hypothetical protein